MSTYKIGLEITTRCNLSCKHCLRERGDKDYDLPLEFIERILKEAKAYGISMVSFTGGEPLVHPQWQKIFELTAREEFEFEFATNGIKLREVLKFLGEPRIKMWFKNLGVSLDGPNPQINDEIRGKGSFNKTVAGIMSAVAKGIPVGVKMVLNSRNYRTIPEMATLATHLGASLLELSHLHPTPDNMREGLVLSPEQWKEVEAEFTRLQKAFRIPLIFAAGYSTPNRFYICAHQAMMQLYVDAKGWLCVCCMLPGIRGRDRAQKEKDRVVDLNKVSLVEGHRKLLEVLNQYHIRRLKRIEKQKRTELENYPCLFCAKYFGKLFWLKNFPESPWAKMLEEEDELEKKELDK